MADRVWFITGVGRGLGRLIAEAALRRGDRVVGTVRALSAEAKLEATGIRTVILDVAEGAAIRSAVEQARSVYGRIDVFCNNSGFGLVGALEEVDEADYRQVFEVNVFGLMAVTRAVLPHLRAQRSGWIINISSVGGISSSAGYGVYNSSKFAVEGLSESLAIQLEPLGIKVLIVEPGHLRTDFPPEDGDRLVEASQPPAAAPRWPRVVREAGLVGESGWVPVDRHTLKTRFERVFALGDVAGIPLKLGKPLPKAGTFARGEAEVVARNIVRDITGTGEPAAYQGDGECYVEVGDGQAALGSGNFYAEPVPQVTLHLPEPRWHAAKVDWERDFLARWL